MAALVGELRAAGVSHRTMSLDRLARVIPGSEEGTVLQSAIAATGVPHVLLVTCNRLECYWADGHDAPARVLAHWVTERANDASAAAVCADSHAPLLNAVHGAGALRHAVRVASGLESMLTGDTDVLGQVRKAWLGARVAGRTDRRLDRIFERIIHAARRVQQVATADAASTSVGRAAVDAIRQELSARWPQAVVAVIGSGAAATSALEALSVSTPRQVWLTGRTPARVAQVTARTVAQPVEWSEREALLARADVAIFAARADRPLFDAERAEQLLAGRKHGSVVWADLGMPPNVALARPVSTLRLLTLAELLTRPEHGGDSRVAEVVDRELVYLHAALSVRQREPTNERALSA